jgi:hypothetical protein
MKQLLDLILATIQNNLNTLIPSLLLKQTPDIKELIKYLKFESTLMKDFLDKICDHD